MKLKRAETKVIQFDVKHRKVVKICDNSFRLHQEIAALFLLNFDASQKIKPQVAAGYVKHGQ